MAGSLMAGSSGSDSPAYSCHQYSCPVVFLLHRSGLALPNRRPLGYSAVMKNLFVLAASVLAALVLPARAQSPDDQYVLIYNLIQEADALNNLEQPAQALPKFLEAQSALQTLQKQFPDWHVKVVSFRLNYLAARIAAVTTRVPAATATPASNAPGQPGPKPGVTTQTPGKPPVPTEPERQLAALQAEVRLLQADKTVLEAKLKEALATQPAAVDPRELTKAQEKIQSLMKESDLLKASGATEKQNKLETASKELYGRKGKDAGGRIDELSGEILALRARLEVFEARAVPYTAAELALFKPAETRLAATAPTAGKKPVRELPADARSLVVEAQRHFSAREFDKAEAKYLEILRQDDQNPLTLANLAAIQLELNHLGEAEKHVQQALATAPDDGYSLSILGYLRFRQEKYDEAFDALSRAAKLNPQSAEIQNYLGVTLSHKGLRGPAEIALRKAIQLDPGYGSAHNNLAVIYVTQPQPSLELARWHYQKALAAGHARNPELEKMLDQKAASGGTP